MKALIITTHIEHQEKLKIIDSYNAVICADAGYIRSKELGLKPDYIIGDYDSSALPDSDICENITVLPCEKDLTDSEAAIDFAISLGADHIDIIGGLGGRFDHTMGNLGILAKYSNLIKHIAILDGQNYIYMLKPGRHKVRNKGYKYIGIVAYSDNVANLSIKGLKYELNNFDLDNQTSLGVSNEFVSDEGFISFDSGIVLVIFSDDV